MLDSADVIQTFVLLPKLDVFLTRPLRRLLKGRLTTAKEDIARLLLLLDSGFLAKDTIWGRLLLILS